jgi:(p)ppGpp synthase/HD superfamily hydrolase
MTNVGLPLLHKAIRRAFKAHKSQDRDGEFALPYITHPIEVVNILRYEGRITDEEVLCAAALHDVVEETAADDPESALQKLEKKFGPRVARIVREVTREEPDRTGLSPEEIWQLRTHLMLQEIDQMSREAKTVKLADRLSNVRNALATRSEDKLFKYIRQTQLILQHIDREVCPPIWEEIEKLASSVKLPARVAQLTPAVPTSD